MLGASKAFAKTRAFLEYIESYYSFHIRKLSVNWPELSGTCHLVYAERCYDWFQNTVCAKWRIYRSSPTWLIWSDLTLRRRLAHIFTREILNSCNLHLTTYVVTKHNFKFPIQPSCDNLVTMCLAATTNDPIRITFLDGFGLPPRPRVTIVSSEASFHPMPPDSISGNSLTLITRWCIPENILIVTFNSSCSYKEVTTKFSASGNCTQHDHFTGESSWPSRRSPNTSS